MIGPLWYISLTFYHESPVIGDGIPSAMPLSEFEIVLWCIAAGLIVIFLYIVL